MPDLEPASALAERILSLYCEGIITTPQVVELIEADRAAVREPLERELGESRKSAKHSHQLYTDLDAEVEAALSKLAPFADEGQELTLTEFAEEAWNSWTSTANELENAEERIASLEAQLASALPWVREGLEHASTEQEARALVGSIEALLTSPPKSPWIPVEELIERVKLAHRMHPSATTALNFVGEFLASKLPPPADQKAPHGR